MSLLIQMQYAAIGYVSHGTKIAFTRVRNGNLNICVMVVDGGNKKRLTDHPARDYEPSWSPDGSKIAFSSRSDGEKIVHIAVMDADGKNRLKLEDHATQPSWFPDGKEIGCVSFRDGTREIYVIGADKRGR